MDTEIMRETQQAWDALHQVAENCCLAWFMKLKPEDPSLEARFMAAFDTAFPQIFGGLLARHEEAMDQVAVAVLKRWIADESVSPGEPSPKTRLAAEAVLHAVSNRPYAFRDAARKQRVKALALVEAGLQMKSVARELGVSMTTARKWVSAERAEFADLKQTLSIYGYTAVKADDVKQK